MKKGYLWILLIGLNSTVMVSQGQIRPVPAEVTNSFVKMFPDAKNIEWRDKLTNLDPDNADARKYIEILKKNKSKSESKASAKEAQKTATEADKKSSGKMETKTETSKAGG